MLCEEDVNIFKLPYICRAKLQYDLLAFCASVLKTNFASATDSIIQFI